MDTYLTITQYESSADQVTLVQNSSMIFDYFEEPSSGANAMLSIMNQPHLLSLSTKGYYVQVIEKNPDMNNYLFLHGGKASDMSFYAKLGNIYLLTDQDMLVRLNEPTDFQEIGSGSGISQIPFVDKRQQIAQKNNVSIENKTTPGEIVVSTTPPPLPMSAWDNGMYPIILTIVILLALLIAVFLYLRKQKGTE